MDNIIILSNPGSASKKYSVFQNDTEVCWFHFEKQSTEYVCSYKILNTFEKIPVSDAQYVEALIFVINLLQTKGVIKNNTDIKSISIRTVIPDNDFVNDSFLTKDIAKYLKTLLAYDPLHIAPVLGEIEVIKKSVSEDIPVCLISDSSFHISAKRVLPVGMDHNVYTIGYHGLSCESVLSILENEQIKHSKLIVCHLGGGSSISAIRSGKSVYNSMDYSPLGGTFMSSRSGSIDPFLILYIMKEKKMTYEETLMFLYTQSGLKALSKVSDDLRVVREEAFKGNQHAKQAIMQFVDSIASYICKATSYTEGVDTLVFTGTIGFRASYIREMVTSKLQWLGITINHDKNLDDIDTCFEISAFDSKIKVYVIQIDEMKEMHRHTKELLKIKI
jgi:acetate kinase